MLHCCTVGVGPFHGFAGHSAGRLERLCVDCARCVFAVEQCRSSPGLALTDASGVRVPASETGHIGLPVRSQEDLDLMLYLQNKQGFASVEHVLAGSGLETVYQYFAQTAGQAHSLSAHQIMAAMADASDPLARQTVQITVRLLAQLCADLALIHLPYGGIYLVGGVARALMPYLKPCDFAASFYAMGRFSKVMERFEVALVHDDYAALTGCANALDGLRS